MVGAILSAFLVARINRRALVFAGVILSIGGNALCLVFVDYEQVMWLRVATGIGSGIFTAVAVVSLACMAGIVMMLSRGITDINVMVSLVGFLTLWTFVDGVDSAVGQYLIGARRHAAGL